MSERKVMAFSICQKSNVFQEKSNFLSYKETNEKLLKYKKNEMATK